MRDFRGLLKLSQAVSPEPVRYGRHAFLNGAAGALFGGAVGAALDRKNRLRGILLGALGGGAAGYGSGLLEDKWDRQSLQKQYDQNQKLKSYMDEAHKWAVARNKDQREDLRRHAKAIFDEIESLRTNDIESLRARIKKMPGQLGTSDLQ